MKNSLLKKVYQETENLYGLGNWETPEMLWGETDYDFTHREVFAEETQGKIFIRAVEEEFGMPEDEPERQEQYLYLAPEEAIKWLNSFLKGN